MESFKNVPLTNNNNETKTNIDLMDNNIYFMVDDEVAIFEREFIREYLDDIVEKIDLQHLNIEKLIDNIYPKLKKVNTIEDIDEQIVMSASEMVTEHYDYPNIAMFILMYRLHETTNDDYSITVDEMRANTNPKGEPAPLVSREYADYVYQNKDRIN